MTDYYLEDRTRLQGQPKRTIGDYVESQGILVPRRFDSLREARASGLPIIARSEHPQEYDGVSGLLESPTLQTLEGVTNGSDLKRKVLDGKDISNRISDYCEFTRTDQFTFREQITFSFWEELDGYNRTVIADSAIKGRYHLTTYLKGNKIVSGTIFENGKVIAQDSVLPIELQERISAWIELYEKIRHLNKFDSTHCPIMEFQTVGESDYFLQYHRTRNFSPASFFLGREPDQDETVALFTRGSTDPNGRTIKVIVEDPVLYSMTKLGINFIPSKEEGYFVMTDWIVYNELLARERNLYMRRAHSLDTILFSLALGHVSRSITFKPELSVFVGMKWNLAASDEAKRLWKKMEKTGEHQSIDLHIVSDGRRAYVKRV